MEAKQRGEPIYMQRVTFNRSTVHGSTHEPLRFACYERKRANLLGGRGGGKLKAKASAMARNTSIAKKAELQGPHALKTMRLPMLKH